MKADRYQIIKIDEQTNVIENGFVRAFLLEGSNRALLIDTGMTLPDARSIAESLTALPVILLNTHADPDHISGNSSFNAFYMHPMEETNYRSHGGIGELLPLCDGTEFDLGGRTLRVIAQPGHTPGSVAVLDVERKTLFSGDAVQNAEIFMFGPHRCLPEYVRSLKRLSKLKESFDVIHPSHGSLSLNPDYIDTLIKNAEEILRGEAEGSEIAMFDKKVIRYAFEKSVFLCDAERI